LPTQRSMENPSAPLVRTPMPLKVQHASSQLNAIVVRKTNLSRRILHRFYGGFRSQSARPMGGSPDKATQRAGRQDHWSSTRPSRCSAAA
jgi:hypothetical protein